MPCRPPLSQRLSVFGLSKPEQLSGWELQSAASPAGPHQRPGEAASAVFLGEGLSRRRLCLLAAGAALLPAGHAAGTDATLLAAWQSEGEQRVGLLSVGAARWSVRRALVVPTRAHGLWAETGGSVLVVARRPGEWLLRWHPRSGTTQWHWVGEDRRFNGHVVARSDGATLWTTETDLGTAQGWLGVREARSLVKTGEWPTHGTDPHQLLALPQAVGDLPAGALMVANGGVPTLPETGRSKRAPGRMDASLVALHPHHGTLLGQWRLDDPYLSIRHLAFDPVSRKLGIALQAEHPDQAARAAAPVLAVWDGRALFAAEGQPALAGYGGDICAWPAAGGGFAVSCPRADTLALFGPQGHWRGGLPHTEVCALASDGGQWWAASGRAAAGVLHGAAAADRLAVAHNPDRLSGLLDNHWSVFRG